MSVAPTGTLFDEITDFILSQPTPEQIIAYQVPDSLNERLHDLLDRNGESQLTADERAELDSFLKIGHLLTMLKAKARLKLVGNE
jgi:hypothetical protein